jgi:hypothetical protein
MNQITITLTPEEMARLEELAAKAGLTPEAFSRLSFVKVLDAEPQRVMSIDEALTRTLSEKRELYERLAR